MATNIHVTVALAASLALLAGPAAAQGEPPSLRSLHLLADAYGQSRGSEQTERFSKSFKVARPATLDLTNISGSVVVTGVGSGVVAIEAVKRVRGRDQAEARRQLAAVTIEAVERASRVEVRTSYEGRDVRAAVDFTVTVPVDSNVYVRSISGDIKVTNARGELRAETMSGDITAADIGRNIHLKSVSGDVSVNAAEAGADVVAESVNGTITTRGLTVRTLEFNTISGDLTASDVRADEARLGTMSGDVEYSGPLAPRGRYSFKSHSGNIRVSVPGETGFQVDASSFSGTVRSDWPVTAQAGGTAERRGTRFGQFLRGTYGDGSAVLQIRTFSGDIVVAKH